MDTKVAIAVITNRQVQPKTLLSLMELIAHTEYQVHPIIATEGYTIAENRTYCVVQAIKNECTHILFVDDDMTFPLDTLEKLMENGKRIVGVMSYSRKLPLSPTVAFLNDEGHLGPRPEVMPTEPFKAYHVGAGVLLIDLSVFQEMPQPWFKFDVHDSGKVLRGEDGYFCDKAKEMGIDVWCDPRLPIGHIGNYTYGTV